MVPTDRMRNACPGEGRLLGASAQEKRVVRTSLAPFARPVKALKARTRKGKKVYMSNKKTKKGE